MKSALFLAGLLVTAPDPAIEKHCPNGICTISAERVQALLDMYNQNIERIQHLEQELRDYDRNCLAKRLREA